VRKDQYSTASPMALTALGSDHSAASVLEAGTDGVAELISTIPPLKSLPAQGLAVTTPGEIESDQ
jgi:hypothetical protein